MRSLADALLYAIIDLGYVSAENAPAILEKLVAGGIDIVQLRGKNRSLDELSVLAEQLLQLTMSAKIPLIANDHAEMARRVEVQGVHVGQDDDSIEKVRSQIKRPIVVGKSTHSIEQAVAAEREGADYIGFGPIFSTPTKPDYSPIGLAQIREVHAASFHSHFLHRRNQIGKSRASNRRRRETCRHRFRLIAGERHCRICESL